MHDATQLPLLVLKGLEANTPPELSSLQEWILAHYETITHAWWLVFFVTIVMLGRMLWRSR